VSEGAAVRIDARLVHVRDHARQLGRAHVNTRELVPAEVVGERHGHRARRVADLAQQLGALERCLRQDLLDHGEGGLDVLDLVPADQKAEVGA
jgi:hypothetical protein